VDTGVRCGQARRRVGDAWGPRAAEGEARRQASRSRRDSTWHVRLLLSLSLALQHDSRRKWCARTCHFPVLMRHTMLASSFMLSCLVECAAVFVWFGMRSDGRCGRDFTSDWSSETFCGKGHCCSSHGWCGHGEEYCSVALGCQSNCWPASSDEKANNGADDSDQQHNAPDDEAYMDRMHHYRYDDDPAHYKNQYRRYHGMGGGYHEDDYHHRSAVLLFRSIFPSMSRGVDILLFSMAGMTMTLMGIVSPITMMGITQVERMTRSCTTASTM
jgi:hypothetical protein